MPRLTADQRNRAIGRLQAGDDPRNVANVFGCHISTIYRLEARRRQTGSVSDRLRSGRPPVTTPAQNRVIVRNFRRDPFQTANEVARTTIGSHGRPINDRTVRRRLHVSGLRNRRPLRRLTLTPQNRAARLAFARNHLNWRQPNWRRVLFTDEVRFCIDPDDRRVRIWRGAGTRYNEANIVQRDRWGGESVMVWGAIGLNQQIGPVFFNFRDGMPGIGVTAQRYVAQVVRPHLLPFFQHNPNHILMQDNATAHTARVTRDVLGQNNINLLPHPPKSPDLNPIEHCWDHLKKAVNRMRQRPQNAAQLQAAIMAAWQQTPQRIMNNLVNSMYRRCAAVYRANGGHTQY